MKLLPVLTLLAATRALVAAAPDKATGSIAADASIVARVGESDVRLDEVKAALARLSDTEQAALSKDPAMLNQVVRLLLVQRLMLNEAKAKKWDERPEVKAAVERARESAIAESYLQSVSEPPPDYPSEAELKATYEAAKPRLAVPKQWRLAQVFVAAPEGASKEEQEKAQSKFEAVKKQLAAKDADFAAIAKAESDEAVSAANGGEIGWLSEAQVQPEIRTDVRLLAEKEMTPPVRMKDGWHIVKCLEIRDAFTPALADVRGALTEQMRKEKTRLNSQAFMARMVQENPLAINEIALAKILDGAGK